MCVLGFPGGDTGKEPTCQCRTPKRQRFNPWVRKMLWRRAWPLTPLFLPGESHGQRSPEGYSPQDCKELNMTKATQHAHTHMYVLVTQSCWTLCDPMDCSPPGSSVHGISQARILERVVILFSSISSLPRNQNWVSCIPVLEPETNCLRPGSCIIYFYKLNAALG